MKDHRSKYSSLLPVQLTQVTTIDGLDLAGVVAQPRGRKKTALIWVHGLTSSFDRGQTLLSLLSQACTKQGIGYLKFNTRGHHLAYYGPSERQPFIGASHERFQDCLKDIEAVVQYARRLGYRQFILAGHSTGAQKVLYYAVKRTRSRIVGLVLAGPASDIAGELKHISPAMLSRRLAIARRQSRHHPDELVPAAWGPWSNQRYLSLFTPGSIEETFPYHRLGGRWTFLKKVRVPLLMISGEKDEYLDQPASTIMQLFEQKAITTKQFTGIIIPGAAHGFQKHQRQFVRAFSRWVQTIR